MFNDTPARKIVRLLGVIKNFACIKLVLDLNVDGTIILLLSNASSTHLGTIDSTAIFHFLFNKKKEGSKCFI